MAQQQLSEEQIKALQEKLKNMSPEELREFQKKQCIFCQIISGKVQAKRVYEDGHVLAILDINPANPGHMLIMPKEHYSIMPQMPDDEIEHIFNVAKTLSNASLRALEVQGSNIIVANGVAAGQRAQHFMVHLIPRGENDGLDFKLPQKAIPEEELRDTAKILAESLGTKLTGQQPANVPSFKPEQKVMDAEFTEKKTPRKKTGGGKTRKKTAKETPKKGSIDLDDIAKMLGAK